MADVVGTLRGWSKTAASNLPLGSTSIGTGLDDNLREIQKVVRQYLASPASNMASGSTVDLSTADGFYVNITGTTTITSFGTEDSGIHYLLKFAGALTLTHNATSLILPGGQSITTQAGDLAWVVSEGSGNWRVIFYTRTGADLEALFGAVFNLGLTFSVAANALTIAVKTQDGGDPTAADPVVVGMRSATLSSGSYNIRTLTAAASLTISSGSTLGHANGVASNIYYYLIDNSGTLELAASTARHGTYGIVSTTAEGGVGGADSATVMYSATARSNVPFILIGKSIDTQTTAGTWAATPSAAYLAPLNEEDTGANVGSGGGQVFKDKTNDQTFNFRTLTTALSGPSSNFVNGLSADTSGDTFRIVYTMGSVPSAPSTPSGPGGSSLHPDSLIEMADGTFEWLSDIRIGDKVKGVNGEIAEVLGIWRNVLNERPLYYVNGVAVTAGHLFKTQDGWACCSAEEYRKRYGDHYVLKTKGGFIDIHCGIVKPEDVNDLQTGDRILVAGGKYVEVKSIEHFSTQGENNKIPAAQEVISLYLDNAKAYYCDGYAVSTIA